MSELKQGNIIDISTSVVHGKETMGFTLIELMIAVAIVGILAAISYPSYTAFVTQSNRSEGQAELLRFANLQEQYFVDYRTYGADLTDLGQGTATVKTEQGNYTISVDSANASTFSLNATALGAQATNDSACSPLTISEAGVKGPTGCWD